MSFTKVKEAMVNPHLDELRQAVKEHSAASRNFQELCKKLQKSVKHCTHCDCKPGDECECPCCCDK